MHACIYIYMLCMKECMYMMQLYCSLAWGARWKLCGEAYRAGQVDMLGINVQRSWIVLLVFFLLRIANLHICNANPEIHWSRRSNSWACWNIHTANDSSTGLACYQFPMSKVPPRSECLCGLGSRLWSPYTLQCSGCSFGAAVAYNISRWGIAVAEWGFSWLAFKDIWSFLLGFRLPRLSCFAWRFGTPPLSTFSLAI